MGRRLKDGDTGFEVFFAFDYARGHKTAAGNASRVLQQCQSTIRAAISGLSGQTGHCERLGQDANHAFPGFMHSRGREKQWGYGEGLLAESGR